MNILILPLLLRSLYLFFFILCFILLYNWFLFTVYFVPRRKLFLVNFINSSQFVRLQLCLALADLALQMSSWQKPVVDLINRFGACSVNLWPLLEIMTVLPEEVNSRSLRYDVISYSFVTIER